jgi:hypothetical protein
VVLSAAFSPDGTRVVTASGDKTVRVWDAATSKPLAPPFVHQGRVRSTAFSPDGTRVVTASADKTARIWETRLDETPPRRVVRAGRAQSLRAQRRRARTTRISRRRPRSQLTQLIRLTQKRHTARCGRPTRHAPPRLDRAFQPKPWPGRWKRPGGRRSKAAAERDDRAHAHVGANICRTVTRATAGRVVFLDQTQELKSHCSELRSDCPARGSIIYEPTD